MTDLERSSRPKLSRRAMMRGVLVTTADITAGGSVLASPSCATASVAATSTVTFDQYSLMVNGERAVAGHLQGGGDHVLAVLIRPMSHQEDGGENVLAIAVTGATACDLGTVTLTNLGTVLGGPARELPAM